MKQTVEFEGATREDIVEQAKEHFNVEDESGLDVEILEEGEKRNLLFQKKAFLKARVSLKGEYVDTRPPVPTKDVEDFLRRVVKDTGIADDVDVADDQDGSIHVEVIGFVSDNLQFGQEILDSLQHVASRFMIRRGPPRRVQIDSQGLRSRRNEEIEDLIQEIHQNVMSGRIFTTGYLQPRERRLIHVGLSELGGVKTISKGQGIRKKVVAMPLRRGRGGGHRRRGGFGYGQRQHQHEDVDGNVASEQSEV